MAERYLNNCAILLLYVERCHRFGTKHLDEYAEQLRPCVIYAESAYEGLQFGSARACIPEREGQWGRTFCRNGSILFNPVWYRSEWRPRRQWTRGGTVNKRWQHCAAWRGRQKPSWVQVCVRARILPLSMSQCVFNTSPVPVSVACPSAKGPLSTLAHACLDVYGA